MSDEEDYMSASFVVDSEKQDIRPGLLFNRNQQRSHNQWRRKQQTDANNREVYKPKKVIEAENLEKALEAPIGPENKGFNLLQKMGYKPGTGIGKSGEGRVDPVPIQLKSDRQGLGREAVLQELRLRKSALRAERLKKTENETVTLEQFRARMTQKGNERLVNSDIFKSQKACHHLDCSEGYTEPAEVWFWPDSVMEKEKTEKEESSDQEEDDNEFEPSEKLEMLTKYLRSTYYYCIWCSVKFEDEKDMRDECPGPTRDDH